MKHSFLTRLLLLAAVSTAPLTARDAVPVSSDALLLLPASPRVQLGQAPATVIAELGEPSAKLAADVWVYWDRPLIGRPAGERYDAMIIVFTQDKVSRIRLTERSAVEALLVKLRANAVKSALIASK